MSVAPSSALLAAIHAAAFDASGEAPWNEAAIEALRAMPGAFVEAEEEEDGAGGFILCRLVGDEAEILTLAVTPASRRRGLGGRLLDRAVLRAAAAGAQTLFLEVAHDNAAALALYRSRGFADKGRRPGYYARRDGSRADALILALNLASRLF